MCCHFLAVRVQLQSECITGEDSSEDGVLLEDDELHSGSAHTGMLQSPPASARGASAANAIASMLTRYASLRSTDVPSDDDARGNVQPVEAHKGMLVSALVAQRRPGK